MSESNWVDNLVAALQSNPTTTAIAVQVGPYLLSNRELLVEWGADKVKAVLQAYSAGGHAEAVNEIAAQMSADQLTAAIAENGALLADHNGVIASRANFVFGLLQKIGAAVASTLLVGLL